MKRRNFLARLASIFGLSVMAAKTVASPPVVPAIDDEAIGTVKMIVGDYIPPGWKLLAEDCVSPHDHTHHLHAQTHYSHALPSIPTRFIVRI